MKNIFFAATVLLLALPFFNGGDKNPTNDNDLHFEVNPIYPPIAITQQALNDAQTLTDLNERFPSSWVREYISIEISTLQKGKTKTAISKNLQLTSEQKKLMKKADTATEIAVKVNYIPENNLKDNPPRIFDFKCSIEPDQFATYRGGQQKLMEYLQKEAINQIPNELFDDYKLATIKFTIDTKGKAINPTLLWTSEDEKVDKLLLDVVKNMPKWKPAQYTDGTKINQEFALMVGDMRSCVVNTVNVRKGVYDKDKAAKQKE